MTGQEEQQLHPLPRGPHGLTRAAVAASQRERLLDATLVAAGDHGYAALSIAQITALARVSRSAFYEQFNGKQDAFLQAYDAFAQQFLDTLAEVSAAAQGPLEAVTSSSELLMRWLTERPSAARGWLVEIYAAGEEGLARRAATMREVEGLFDLVARWIRRIDPALQPVVPIASRAVVAASFELLSETIRHPTEERIAEATRAISEIWILGMTAPRYLAVGPGGFGGR